MSTDTSEKGGTTSCATSCAPCGEAETLFPTDDEREIDRLRGRIDRAVKFLLNQPEGTYQTLGGETYIPGTVVEEAIAILEGRP